MLDLTKSQLTNLSEFIEFHFIDSIRNDDEIDNINYVVDMMEAYAKISNEIKLLETDVSHPVECPYKDCVKQEETTQ